MTPEPMGADEYRGWLRPIAVLEIFKDWGFETTASTLATRLQAGLIHSVAKKAILVRNRDEDDYYRIPKSAWIGWACLADRDFWRTGDVVFYSSASGGGYGGERSGGEYFGVRFDPNDIRELSEEVSPSQAAPDSKPRRGARRKDWWDHLWIEMIRRIQAGTLTPKNIAELQETLEEYAGNVLNEDYGDSTLKPMASNLFKYLQELGGK